MRYRTFVAIEVSPFSRDRLRGLQAQLAAAGEGIRWVEAPKFHMTLVFLGDVDEREVIKVCRAVEDVAAAHAPFSFTLQGVGAFPNLRRPRTLIAKVSDGAEAIRQLQLAIEVPLLELGCYRREVRGFTPHVTVGRVTRDASEELPRALQKFAVWQGGETNVTQVHVLASNLGPGGPEYTTLGRAKLTG